MFDDIQPEESTGAVAIRTNLGDIVAKRSLAFEAVEEMIGTREQALVAERQMKEAIAVATGGVGNIAGDDSEMHTMRDAKIVETEAQRLRKMYRTSVDRGIWRMLVDRCGFRRLMDATAFEAFEQSLLDDVAEATEENLTATFETMFADQDLIFKRGLAKAFITLDPKFKSHDAFKIGSRIIINHMFDAEGRLRHGGRAESMLLDVERVMSVLDAKNPEHDALTAQIRRERNGARGARQSEHESSYFKIRCYMNGNAHLFFARDDLVERANKVLADYYGEVIPDAVEKTDDSTATKDMFSSRGVAKDLQFYATPRAAADALIDASERRHHFKDGARILEPSAGEGGLIRPLLALRKNLKIDAIEVDPVRAAMLRNQGWKGVTTREANFLDMDPRPIYDHVVMNPPFFGTHYMQHVMHAYEFLKPSEGCSGGSTLCAILPASAEVLETPQHIKFRAWLRQRRIQYGRSTFEELPPESFASSGTNVNTVIVRLVA